MPFKLFIYLSLSLSLFLALTEQLSLETKNRKALRLFKALQKRFKNLFQYHVITIDKRSIKQGRIVFNRPSRLLLRSMR